MALRSDVRTRVRDYIYESTADLISDTQLNRLIAEEIYSLPKKNIYLQEIHTTSTVVDQIDYALPTGTIEVELLERNDGAGDKPVWTEINGFDVYGNALYLPYRPSKVDTIRIHISKQFSVPTDDTTAYDVPDDQLEVVVWGTVCRVYRMLMGYFRNSKNWDAISKPDGVSLSSVQNWLRDAERHYTELVKQYAVPTLPRDIDLVS